MLRAQPDTNGGGEKRSIHISVFIDIESDDSYDMINGFYICEVSCLSRKFGRLNVQTGIMLGRGGSGEDSSRTFYNAETRPNPAMMLEAVEMWVYILQRWLLRAIIITEGQAPSVSRT